MFVNLKRNINKISAMLGKSWSAEKVMHYKHPKFLDQCAQQSQRYKKKKIELNTTKIIKFAGKNSFQHTIFHLESPSMMPTFAQFISASVALHVVLHETFANSPPFDWELLYLSHWSSGRKCGISAANAKQRIAAVPTHQALCGIPKTNSSQTA